MSQTSVTELVSTTPAFEGMLADSSDHFAESFVSESTADLFIGRGVKQGTADNGATVLATPATTKVLGLILHAAYGKDPSGDQDLTTGGIHKYAVLSVLRKGRMWAICEDGCAPGDRLYVRFASGVGGSNVGALRSTSVSSSETIDATACGVWRTTAAAGALAVLDVDFVNKQ